MLCVIFLQDFVSSFQVRLFELLFHSSIDHNLKLFHLNQLSWNWLFFSWGHQFMTLKGRVFYWINPFDFHSKQICFHLRAIGFVRKVEYSLNFGDLRCLTFLRWLFVLLGRFRIEIWIQWCFPLGFLWCLRC